MEHKLYDKTLKELFSRPEIVRDFMKGFVDSDFVGDIDFNRIEKKNTSSIIILLATLDIAFIEELEKSMD